MDVNCVIMPMTGCYIRQTSDACRKYLQTYDIGPLDPYGDLTCCWFDMLMDDRKLSQTRVLYCTVSKLHPKHFL